MKEWQKFSGILYSSKANPAKSPDLQRGKHVLLFNEKMNTTTTMRVCAPNNGPNTSIIV